jgi:hypothetical protein
MFSWVIVSGESDAGAAYEHPMGAALSKITARSQGCLSCLSNGENGRQLE